MFDFITRGGNVCNDPEHTINSLATPQQLHSKSLATTQNILATN